MKALNKQALLNTDKHANQHRLSRLTMEVHSDELRIIASAVESYTDELIAALEVAEKRIAEQQKTLNAARSYVKSHAAGDAHAFGVLQAIDRAAGIGVKGE
ncbi:hypothetical protein [Citrobacter youngae]|uniref:hypothetical protein n=1 Tax=Citrobacter youngae TaxID=133448 RepID=UPI00397BC836